MPRYEVEFKIKGTIAIDGPTEEYAHDVFYDKDIASYADAGDVEIVCIEKVEDYKE